MERSAILISDTGVTPLSRHCEIEKIRRVSPFSPFLSLFLILRVFVSFEIVVSWFFFPYFAREKGRRMGSTFFGVDTVYYIRMNSDEAMRSKRSGKRGQNGVKNED